MQCVFIASSHILSDTPERHLPHEVGQERLAHEETEIHPVRLSDLSKGHKCQSASFSEDIQLVFVIL